MNTAEENQAALGSPPVARNDSLELAFSVTHGYIHRLQDKFKPGLRFTEAGLARATCVCGWLTGIAQGGNVELANTLAEDFFGNLKYLAEYGGISEYSLLRYDGETSNVRVPAYTVELGDDGTSHGFTIMWYQAISGELQKRATEFGREIKTFDRWPEVPHVFAFNGGLIYHGPGGGETFTVQIPSCGGPMRYWGVHT